MHRRYKGLVRSIAVGGWLLALATQPGRAQSIALHPVGSTAPFVIDNGQITTGPGSIVTLEVRIAGWGLTAGNPQLFAAQASIEPAGLLGAQAEPENVGVDLLPLGYAPPDPLGGDRELGLFVVTHVCAVSGRDCTAGQPVCAGGEGACALNPRWVVGGCCSVALTNTDGLPSYGVGGACQCGTVTDPGDPSLGYLGTLRLQVPVNARGTYTVHLKPDFGQGDGSYMLDPFNVPISGVTLMAATLLILPTPNYAPSPDDIAKNRFVSFVPATGPLPVAHEIRLVASTFDPAAVGFVGWVGEPSTAPGLTSRVVTSPVFRIWDEPVIHVGDCEIMPGAVYEIRATGDGVTYSAPVVIATVPRPGGGKDWCDVAGVNNGTQWTPPNGVANIQDVMAIRSYISAAAPIPTAQRVNLQGISTADSCLNNVVNTADTLAAILAIGGQPYPFQTNPGLCADCAP